MALRVLITDVHPVSSESLRQRLGDHSEMGLTCETVSGMDVLRMIPVCQPDVLLVQLPPEDMQRLELIEQVRNAHPSLPVLVMSADMAAQFSVRALILGAASRLSKDSTPEDLARGLLQAMEGLASQVQEAVGVTPARTVEPPPHAQLTQREMQVFRMLVSGQSVNEVAASLALSANTVSTHKRRLMDKLGVANNAGLVRYALAHGVIE